MADSTTADWIIDRSKRYPLLTAAEEIELSRQVQDWLALKDKPNPTAAEKAILRRGKRAYDRFFQCNIRLVVSLANRYTRIGGNMLPEDLIQEGLLGLERAIVKFDPTRGYKFSTYAFNWIRQAINRSINSKGKTIRLPEHAYHALRKASDFISHYQSEHGRMPAMELVAEHSGVQASTLRMFMRVTGPVISLDDQVNTPNGGNYKNVGTYMDLVAADLPEASYVSEMEDKLLAMHEALGHLTPKQQSVIAARYYSDDRQPLTFTDVAKQLDTTRQNVQNIHNKALRCLRVRINNPAAPPDIPALQSAA